MQSQTKHDLKIIAWILAFIALAGIYSTHKVINPIQAEAPYAQMQGMLPDNPDKENLTVLDKIMIEQSKNPHIPLEEAVDIAICESNLGKNKRNWQGSSASGVYMFINSTWDRYCDGYQMNDDDNIKCFFKLYADHKSWWECARIEGYI